MHLDGLNGTQWLWCLIPSVFTLAWNVVLKFVPDRICPTLGDEDPDDVSAAKEDYAMIQAIAKMNEKKMGA